MQSCRISSILGGISAIGFTGYLHSFFYSNRFNINIIHIGDLPQSSLDLTEYPQF